MPVRTLDGLDVTGKRVLLRADLNVPMHDGKITDMTRIGRLLPTIRELASRGARVVVCSHFDRPKGQKVAGMSLAPMAPALAQVLGQRVRFAEDCIGAPADQTIDLLRDGEVALLENTRFHPGEEANDPAFAAALAKHADVFVNDAFSAAHALPFRWMLRVQRLIPRVPPRLLGLSLSAMERKRFVDWSFGHYLEIAHPRFVGTRPRAALARV